MLRALATPARAEPPDALDADSDTALVAAAQANPETFGELYRRYLPRLYRYLCTRAATPEEAADLTQQAFLRAFDALPGYRPGPAGFAPWLFRIARNLATDAHRRARPQLSWEFVPPLPAASGDPEEAALRAERLARLRERVAALEPGARELLALRFAGGLSARQIAPLVGRSESAVKKQLSRTMHTLKEQYRDEPA